jgi:hypothetical protein
MTAVPKGKWRPLTRSFVCAPITTYEGGPEQILHLYRVWQKPSYSDRKGHEEANLIGDCTLARPKPSTVGHLAVSEVPLGDPEQAAAYVAGITGELASLVRRHRLDTLGYLLDMVRLEAEEAAQRAERVSGEHRDPARG